MIRQQEYFDGRRFAEHRILSAVGVHLEGRKHVLGIASRPRKTRSRSSNCSCSPDSPKPTRTRRRDEPCARIGRYAVPRPLHHRHGERFMQCFFSRVEVAEQTDQCRQYVARFGQVDLLYALACRVCRIVAHGLPGYAQPSSFMGRTSTLPKRAAGN